MKYIINKDEWGVDFNNGVLDNSSSDKVTIKYNKKIHIKESSNNKIYLSFYGKAENSGCYLNINEYYKMPINSEITMPIKAPVDIELSITIAANSKVELEKLIIDSDYKEDFVDSIDETNDVLVIAPYYPSYVNLYNCAFAHSRTKEYVKAGIKVQVFAVNENNWFQTRYEKDNIPVFVGTYQNLKTLLSEHHYKIIISHFVDENLYPIFDGNVYNNQKLIFICHGPETVYNYLVNKTRPYFTAPCKEPISNALFDMKDNYVKKYSEKDNVEWIFVSDWLKEKSEKELNISFKNSHVINNIIDEKLFPYSPRKEEDRKKIVVVRKFDNICQHSIDNVVRTILELSRRDIFEDLEFNIYGDGNYYDELVEPIKNLSNVHLYRRFVPNEDLHNVYNENGIMLLPSRHDTQGVSMCEAASCGLPVVSTKVCAASYFLNEKDNHTLADDEDYTGLADIIERLYNNPDEYLKISENMSKYMRKFDKTNTVEKEIKLIKDLLNEKNGLTFNVSKAEKPVLTIGIPAYNVEKYLEKCLVSVLNARNASKIEILVVNDGSKDSTADIAEKYAKESHGIVRVINKENGGHGSTINRAIKEAKGKYFRLVDGDDWVDSENLAKLVDIMEHENSDIILTKGSYDYVEEAMLVDIIKYDFMLEGKQYHFEDLTYANFGFEKYGPLLTTGNYKTELLRKANFMITEKKPYVDMEFNAFSIKYMDTITYYNLDIYRYLIGREGQTVSKDYWKKKYKDHEYIVFNILDKVLSDTEYTERKKMYVLEHLIASMVDSQIFMFDAICKWDEIDEFLDKLRKYPEAYQISMDYIEKLDGNCRLILSCYKKYVGSGSSTSIVIPGVRETLNDVGGKQNSFVKKVAKAIIPYGLLVLIRNKRKTNSLR